MPQPPAAPPPSRLPIATGLLGIGTAAQFWMPALAPAVLVGIGYLSLDIFRMAATCLVRERRVRVDVLDAVVVSVCVAQRQIAGAALTVWVLDIVDILQARARNRSEGFITDAFGAAPRHAWLLRDGQELRTEVRALKRGDVIVVQTGDQIPVDGRVAAGAAMIDQHRVTGASAPVERHADDKVYAMTVLVAGRIEVEVEETGADTLACQVVQIIEQAASSKTEAQSSGERIAERMVLPTLGLATLGYFTTGNSGMLAIINADYGTGIRIAAPIGLLSTLGRAARHGVLIEDSGVLESLRDIDVVLFDKTGTLTYDVPAVSAVVVAGDDYGADEVIRYAAAAERKLSHPLARAVLAEAEARGLELPGHDEASYHVGLGIEVLVEGRRVQVDSATYLEQEGIGLPAAVADALAASRRRGHSAILVAIDAQAAGLIELRASVRDGAVEVISHLHARGVREIALISGDHEAPTRELAAHLGITVRSTGNRAYLSLAARQRADAPLSGCAPGDAIGRRRLMSTGSTHQHREGLG